MITNEQITQYLRTLEREKNDFIEYLEQDAINSNIPIIKREVQSLLRVILSIYKPNNILEIGTAIGYSSILMSQYINSNGQIVTIERNKKMIKKAKENIKNANKDHLITIIEGDALEELEKIDGQFDFIFMDAAKGQYLYLLPYCLKLLKTNGVLISDNVLQGGNIAKSRYSIPRRQRTIHVRMREYLYMINNHPNLETSILPIADGLTISYKKL